MAGLMRALLVALAAFAVSYAAPARAHPHVFVDVDLQIEVGEDGTPKRLRHTWTFDEMYSAFVLQGLPRAEGKARTDALGKLAEEIVDKLDGVDYFTITAAEDHELQAIGAEEARASVEDGRLRLSFSIGLRSIKGEARRVSVRVFDPSYVVALTLKDDVKTSGPVPCRHTIRRPGPLDAADARQLDDSTRTNQLDANFGAKLATTVAVDCTAP